MGNLQVLDQATGLRRMRQPHPVRVIAVTGGKGGVGKTNVAVNLAMAMSHTGKKVLIMDADLGLGNIDVLLGLHPHANLHHVITGERTLEEVIIDGPANVKVIPAASGIQNMAQLSSQTHAGLITAFSELSQDLDVLIIDTAAGISDTVISFARAAQELVVVVTDEPASITDAYAIIKLLSRDYGVFRFHVVANMAQSAQHGREIYAKIIKVSDRFLDVALDYMGYVPEDEFLRKSVKKQRAVVEAFPRSKSSQAFASLAEKANKWPLPGTAGGHLEFFVERLIQTNTSKIGAVS
ncbi:MAG: MinD/ParA family protein [Gammaproteobacteria bacterium]|nr:MinD/ParA family protein [Gammaproteobacteria bacterium]